MCHKTKENTYLKNYTLFYTLGFLLLDSQESDSWSNSLSSCSISPETSRNDNN